MASEPQIYPKTAQSAVNRHKEGGHYDATTIHYIVNAAPVAHVSFVPDPAVPVPVVLRMVARIGTFPGSANSEPAVYIHGYASARMFRTATPAGRSSASPEEDDNDDSENNKAGGDEGLGLPVCIAATKIDNLVLGLTPFNHSYDYRSAVVHGRATLLDPGTRAWRRATAPRSCGLCASLLTLWSRAAGRARARRPIRRRRRPRASSRCVSTQPALRCATRV